MTSPDRELTLHFGRDAAGRVAEWWWRDRHEVGLPGSGLSTWSVEHRDGSMSLCRRLPPEIVGGARKLEKLLDNEIRAMSRLAQRYGRLDYPAELPRLVGYDFDSAEPYLLCVPFRGVCAEDLAPTLLSDQRISFTVGLLRALAALAAVGLVHGAVGLSTTWWDGTRVQLVGFEYAVVAGEPRRVADHSRWVSPEQIRGIGPAHPGDDVFAAGLVIYELFTGIRPDRTDELDLGLGGPMLRELLTGIFYSPPERRPTAIELLRRLNAGTDLPTPADVEVALRPGRARFEQARRRKYPSSPDTAVPDPGVPTPSATPLNRRFRPPDAAKSKTPPVAQAWRPPPTSSVRIAFVIGLLILLGSLVLVVALL